MNPVGPIIDGHVEIPLGSGNRFRAWGMLSRHPQCDAIRRVVLANGYPNAPDVPIVFDHFAPHGSVYWLGTWVAVNPATAEKIERVWVLPPESGDDILCDLGPRVFRLADRFLDGRADDPERRIGLTDLPNGDHVSTVRLCGHGEDEPEAYETMVTSGPHEGRIWRYGSRKEAVVGHFAALDELRALG